LPPETHARDAQDGTHGGVCTAVLTLQITPRIKSAQVLCIYVRMYDKDTKLFMESAHMGSFTLPKRSARRMVMRPRPWITAMTLLY